MVLAVSAVTVVVKKTAGPGPIFNIDVWTSLQPPQSTLFVKVAVEVQTVEVGPAVNRGNTTWVVVHPGSSGAAGLFRAPRAARSLPISGTGLAMVEVANATASARS